jgi:hypothetical protein
VIRKDFDRDALYDSYTKGLQKLIRDVLNLKNDLTLIGKKLEVSDRMYQYVLKGLSLGLQYQLNQMRLLKSETVQQTHKDHYNLVNIGEFSLVFEEKFILPAYTSSRAMPKDTQLMKCQFSYSVSSYDSFIPGGTELKATSSNYSSNLNLFEARFTRSGNEITLKCNNKYSIIMLIRDLRSVLNENSITLRIHDPVSL